jgi:hypothetical protein
MMTDFAPPGGLQSWAASFWAGVLMRTPPSGGLTGSSVLSGACPYKGRGSVWAFLGQMWHLPVGVRL